MTVIAPTNAADQQSAGGIQAELAEIVDLLGLDGLENDVFELESSELRRLVRIGIPALDKSTPMKVIEAICELYRQYTDSVDVDTRGEMVEEIVDLAVDGLCDPRALKVIALLEESAPLVELAASTFLFLQGRLFGSSFLCAHDLFFEVVESSPPVRSGVFAAMVNTGEPEVLDVIRPFRGDLDPWEVNVVARLTAAASNVDSVLFLVEWLAEIDHVVDRREFDTIANAIGYAARLAEGPFNKTTPRRFPPDAFGPETSVQVDAAVLSLEVEPLLRQALSRVEPNLLSRWVLDCWGIPIHEGAN